MADGYYSSWTNYRCGVCQKFFHLAGKPAYFGTSSITCPHCQAALKHEPPDPNAVYCSGVSSTFIVGTGIPLASGAPTFHVPIIGFIGTSGV